MRTKRRTRHVPSIARVIIAFGLGHAGSALANDDAGPYPANYRQITRDWLRKNLKDPWSMRDIQIMSPRRVRFWTQCRKWVEVPAVSVNGRCPNFDCTPRTHCADNRYEHAYRVCFSYNAKNGFGAYTGSKFTAIFVRDGVIVRQVTHPVAALDECQQGG